MRTTRFECWFPYCGPHSGILSKFRFDSRGIILEKKGLDFTCFLLGSTWWNQIFSDLFV